LIFIATATALIAGTGHAALPDVSAASAGPSRRRAGRSLLKFH